MSETSTSPDGITIQSHHPIVEEGPKPHEDKYLVWEDGYPGGARIIAARAAHEAVEQFAMRSPEFGVRAVRFCAIRTDFASVFAVEIKPSVRWIDESPS